MYLDLIEGLNKLSNFMFLMNLAQNLNCHRNLITGFSYRPGPLHKIYKSVYDILNNSSGKKTNTTKYVPTEQL